MAFDSDRLVPSTLYACATVLIYDWLCTLDREISCVWPRPWSPGTVLFMLNRYLPFIDVSLGLSAKTTRISPEQCLTRFKIVGWLSIIGVYISEAILMMRTYALWENRRGVLVFLAILAVCTAIATALFTELELASLRYVQTPGIGCELGAASTVIIYAYLALMVSETTIVVMTAIRAYHDLRRTRQPWLVKLYRTGILFYIYLLAISLANMLLPIFGPPALTNWLSTPQRVLHSVLCTRVLLLIRGQHMRRASPSRSNLTELIFAAEGVARSEAETVDY
ncbi:hypothetical protein B0H15DRAFT_863804 [Mycena belliarum]|uniref:DUF6533 domain-containing protein n=1 Tax=Mycena belliarum TaxID=1033014 RepID=A0AAD6XG37_9AGAR|nr:hypothetical protein B0H15DRAFT_863804 [Mycena belliae]